MQHEKKENMVSKNHKKNVMRLLMHVQEMYIEELRMNLKARSWLLNRGISEETSNQFGIGLAPEGWDFITSNKGFNDNEKALLEEVGVIKRKDARTYDFFRNRITIPIFHDTVSDLTTVGFSCRKLDENDDQSAKYINSPTSEYYNKSELLYNFQPNKKGQSVVVTEGVMDVIMLHQLGVYAVAPLGTALTKKQIELLKDHDNKITLMFDGDNAGREATAKALKSIWEISKDISVKIAWISSPKDDAGSIAHDIIKRGGNKSSINNYVTIMEPYMFMVINALRIENTREERHHTNIEIESVEQLARMVANYDKYGNKNQAKRSRELVETMYFGEN